MLKHDCIGTEHILLGLLREGEGLAARVLESLDITVERARAALVRVVGFGEEATPDQVPFTQRAKEVLELALAEALSLGHTFIGTEHILLGLTCEKESVGARVLMDLQADSAKIRSEVIRMLSSPVARRPDRASSTADLPFALTRIGFTDGASVLVRGDLEETQQRLGETAGTFAHFAAAEGNRLAVSVERIQILAEERTATQAQDARRRIDESASHQEDA